MAPASVAGARPREQTRARYPDLSRVRRARRRARLLRGVRVRRADHLAAADVVDRPLALLEGADPLPGAPLPGRDVRRPRQRPLRPAGRRSRVHPGRVRRRRARGDGRDRHRAGGAGGALLRRAVGARSSPPTTPSASTASSTSAPRSASRPATPSGTCIRSTSRSTTDEGWAKYNSHYWQRDYLGFLEFFFAKCFNEPHSSKQIEDCIGWALETDPETLADTTRGIGLRLPDRELQGHVRPRSLPDARDPRRRRTSSARTRRARRSPRQPAASWSRCTARATSRPRAIRSRSTCCCASSPSGRQAADLRLDARPRRAGGGRCTSPRRSASATRSATSRSPTSCAGCTPTSRSTGSPSTRSRRCSRRAASGSTRRAPSSRASRATSSPSRPSTTCTAFQAIRRMDEILVANFMVFHDLVARRAVRPLDRRRGVGARLLPAREPGAEDGRLRVADRLRRVAADARRRRARGSS